MYFIYNMFLILIFPIFLLYFGINFLFFSHNKKFIKNRFGFIDIKSTNSILIHAISAGEVVSTFPLIKELQKKTHKKIILSTGTNAGFILASQKLENVEIIFFPFDFWWSIKKTLKTINPSLIIIMEVEIWPNLLLLAHKLNIPIVMMNGRIYKKDLKAYKKLSFFFKKILNYFTICGMQSEEDKNRLIEIGAPKEKVIFYGNTKFDYDLPEKVIFYDIKIPFNQQIIVAGSTHKDEDKKVLEVYKNIRLKYENVCLIIAPRHLDRIETIEKICQNLNLSFCKRTNIKKNTQVIILDTIGELGKIYSLANIVFIGGSLVPIGGHNLIEAAIFAKPIIFGHYMENFKELKNLFLSCNGAIEIQNVKELEQKFIFLLENEIERNKIGNNAYKIIKKNQGITLKYIEMIKQWL
ncbi:MAG: 3-deoxy-D-manno-octulosonic acid transferase [bacterium]